MTSIEQRYWIKASDGVFHTDLFGCPHTDCRPVVVLDPDDAEKAQSDYEVYADATREDLIDGYLAWRREGQRMHAALLDIWRALDPAGRKHMTFGDDPQAVVTEVLGALPTPPVTKPAEPKQLGAVVEDEGVTWVRADTDGPGTPWLRPGLLRWQKWDSFSDAVTIVRGDQ